GLYYDFLTVQITFQATASTSWLDVTSAGFPGLDVGQYSVQIEKASLVDAVESQWPLPPMPSNIKVYFAGASNVTNAFEETYVSAASTSGEVAAALHIFQNYSGVANVAFTVVDNPAEADLVIVNRIDSAFALDGQGLDALPIEIDGVIYNTALVELGTSPGMI